MASAGRARGIFVPLFPVIVMPRAAVAAAMTGAGRHDGRDRVLEDELLLVVRLEHDAVLVETAYSSRELDAARQVDGDGNALLARGVQEGVL